MPHLILFAACRTFLVDEGSKNISLINVMDRVAITVQAGQEVPSDALTPFEWYAVSWWLNDSADQGKSYEQRVQMLTPDGNEVFGTVMPLDTNASKYRVTARLDLLPVAPSGIHSLVLSVHEVDKEWERVADYPITIDYQEAPQPEVVDQED